MLHTSFTTRLKFLWTALACTTFCATLCTQALAQPDSDGAPLAESAQVAGTSLKLNGAGIGFRLVFKVYALGLYLVDTKASVPDILAAAGPRRILITMLRDVGSEDFSERLMQFVSGDGEALPAKVGAHMVQLGHAIADQAQGLHKGDTLTLDWIPGTGTVIALNKKPLAEPIPEMAFYNALLNIWLGEKPIDSALKTKLLGNAASVRTAMN